MMSFSLSGGVEVYGFIAPTEITDEYPVIDPLYGIDGFRNVDTLNDLNNIPTLRRRAGMVVGIGGGTQYYKLNPGPWNGTITDWTIFNTGGGGVFTGGTVTGSTIFTNGLTANTLTVNGVPITGDTYTTGGTYSNGTIDFYYNTGGGYQVVGLYTGETSYVNSLTTGTGLSANTTTGNITIINTNPDQVVSISGGTGILTGGTYPNFTIQNTLPDQVVSISGGTNVDVTGTYPNFNIALTGITDNNRFTTGFTYNNNTFTISDNSGSTYNATINSVTGLTINGDLTVTGTTSLQGFSATTISATTISAPGSTTQVIYNNGGVLSADTGFVYTGNKITLGQSGATTASSGEIILNSFTTGANVGGIRVEQTGAGIEIGGTSYYDKIFTTNGTGIRFWTYVSGSANTERMRITSGTGTNWGVGINTTTPLATLHVAGTNLMSAATQNVLTVIGSGNTNSFPIFSVQGSQGELFSVTDSLTGSLFSVNDISGLPVIEVFSDDTILMGSFDAPSLNTTARVIATTGTTNVYSIPTSAYTGAFFDYTVSDGTNLRAGNIMSIWSGTSVNITETQTTDFGNTSGLTFNMVVSSGNAILRTSGVTGNWTVKTIVRSI